MIVGYLYMWEKTMVLKIWVFQGLWFLIDVTIVVAS